MPKISYAASTWRFHWAVLANEIITNAVKHAFPDSRSGRIEVSICHCGHDVLLWVRDNGIGDTGKAGRGIGKQLITALAAQLRAEISVDVQAGTLVQVRLPAEDFKRCPTKLAVPPVASLRQHCYSALYPWRQQLAAPSQKRHQSEEVVRSLSHRLQTIWREPIHHPEGGDEGPDYRRQRPTRS